MTYTNVSNTADIIDTRDLLEREEELQTEIDDEVLDNDGQAELIQLTALLAQVRDYAEDSPEDGVCLIRDSYFETYAQELHDDTRDAPDMVIQWPYTHISWPDAAHELQTDYTSVDYGDVEYWVR